MRREPPYRHGVCTKPVPGREDGFRRVWDRSKEVA